MSAPKSVVAKNLAQAKVPTDNVTPSLVTVSGLSADIASGGTEPISTKESSGIQADSADKPAVNHFQVPPISGRLIAQATPEGVSPLEDNTRAILLKLIELEKYNLNYHLNVAKQGRWKGWRYFVSQQGNNLTSGAGSLVGTINRMSHLNNPTRLYRRTLEDGNILGLVGQTIGASGSATEFLINLHHDLEARQKGYSPKAARTKVLTIRKDIDALMNQREKLINEMEASGRYPRYIEMARAEEPVLMDIRNLSLNEFKQFHTHLRRVLAFQQTLYMGDITRNVVGAMGNRFGWDALRSGNRYFNQTAGVLGDISGGITLLNPIFSRGVGKLVGEYHGWYIRKCMKGVDPDSVDVARLNADVAHLKAVANSPELEQLDLPVLRTALYADHETSVRSQIHLEERELRAGVLTAAENVVSGTIIGSSKIASGVLFNIAGEGMVHSAKGTNQLLGPSNVIGLSASTYGLLETARIQVKREIAYQRMKRRHESPGQIMKDRLAQLDKMEKQLRAN